MPDIPVKLKVEPRYSVEFYHEGNFIGAKQSPMIPEVEEFVARGRDETLLDLYEATRQVGGEPFFILGSFHEWGIAKFPDLEPAFKKVEEDRWDEITDEEHRRADEELAKLYAQEFVVVWTPADVEWSPEVLRDREIYHRKYSYEELMAMRAGDVENIARVKGIKVGRKEEMAKSISVYDLGDGVLDRKLDELEKALKEMEKPETVGEHAERWSREFEEAKRKVPEEPTEEQTLEELQANIEESLMNEQKIAPWSERERRLVERTVKYMAKKFDVSEDDLLDTVVDDMGQKHFYVGAPFPASYYIKLIERRAKELKELEVG
jgi:hypothetical protein